MITFRTPDEAVEKANNTMYGLSAGIWTDKGAKIFWMAQRLKAGVIWGNTYNKFDPTSPFGGYKESGFGREGGRQGLARVRGARVMAHEDRRHGATRRSPRRGRRSTTRASVAPLDGSTRERARHGEQGVQDVRRRRVRALRVGAVFPGEGARPIVERRGPRRRQHAARLAQGRARRRPRREERARRLGGAHGVQPRADPLSPRRGDGVAPSELVTSLVRGGLGQGEAEREVAASVDRAVYYAGFADKFQALVASSNPVAGDEGVELVGEARVMARRVDARRDLALRLALPEPASHEREVTSSLERDSIISARRCALPASIAVRATSLPQHSSQHEEYRVTQPVLAGATRHVEHVRIRTSHDSRAWLGRCTPTRSERTPRRSIHLVSAVHRDTLWLRLGRGVRGAEEGGAGRLLLASYS